MYYTDHMILDTKIIEIISKTIGNNRLTATEIINKTKLPITLQGINPILKKHFKSETIKTNRTLHGLKFTNKGLVSYKFKEEIIYWRNIKATN